MFSQDLTVKVVATSDQPIKEEAYADVTVKLGLMCVSPAEIVVALTWMLHHTSDLFRS
ncbi:hypothetical protein B0J17DRAFT_687471 [Rhizoctonia solani]|nr:hypothetical protein B0J17DRAFT_687471 [Rhizoctonia solani]